MALAETGIAATFSIGTPGDWFDIRLPQTAAAAQELTGLLAQSFPGLASSAEELSGLVGSLIGGAAALDVLAAYAVVLNDGQGHLLPASLVINAFPLHGKTLTQVAEQLSGGSDAAGAQLPRLAELPAGPAIRTERLREWDVSAQGRQPVSLIVQYVAAVPGTVQALVLTFSTPALGLAEQLRPVFHGIAATLQFAGQADTLRFDPADGR